MANLSIFLYLLLAIGKAIGRYDTAINMKVSFDPAKAQISTTAKTFDEFMKNSDIFIDNSLILKYILSIKKNDAIVISYPHKWGKTMTLHMIKNFLEAHSDKASNPIRDFKMTPSYRLFGLGEVGSGKQMVKLKKPFLISNEKDIFFNNVGKWPVILLNFTKVFGNTYQEFEDTMKEMVRDAYKEHQYVRQALYKVINAKTQDPKGKEKAQKYLDRYSKYLDGEVFEEDDKGILCIDFLCEVLEYHYKKTVYILVDDADFGLNYMRFGNITFSGADKYNYLDLWRQALIHTHMSNFVLERWIIFTTVSYGKTSILPPFDLVINHDLLHDDICPFFGFNQTEANTLFDLMQIPQQLRDEAHNRYWGYNTGYNGTTKRYNTWDIVNFVNTKVVHDYWMDSSYQHDFLYKFLKIPKFVENINAIYNNTRQTIRIKNRNITVNDYRYIQIAENATYKRPNTSALDVVLNVHTHVDLFKNDTEFRDLFDWSGGEEEWITEAFTKIAVFKLLYMYGYVTLERSTKSKKPDTFYATFPNEQVKHGIKYHFEELTIRTTEAFYY